MILGGTEIAVSGCVSDLHYSYLWSFIMVQLKVKPIKYQPATKVVPFFVAVVLSRHGTGDQIKALQGTRTNVLCE